MQKLLCHGNYCELVLSPVRASFKQPSAARPATGPTNSVAHPSIRGFKQPSAARPATGPTNSVAHPSIRGRAVLLKRCLPKHAPNSRQLMTRLPPRCRTSIIQSSALVQASFSLSIVALAARPRTSSPTNFYFSHFSPRVFHHLESSASFSIPACLEFTRPMDAQQSTPEVQKTCRGKWLK